MNDTTNKPGRAYFFPKEVTAEKYRLTGAQHPAREEALRELTGYVTSYRAAFAGYQSTAQLDNKHLTAFIESAVNNIGDAFANPELTDPNKPSQLADGYFSLNAKWVERAVLDYFAERWNAGSPRKVKADGDPSWEKTYWGYVLSMGATEGNLMALRSARDYLKGRELLFEPNADDAAGGLRYVECQDSQNSKLNPVLLYSKASHYSVRKLAQMLELESRVIDIDPHGRMDLDGLLREARRVLHEEKRPLAVLFNYGTTWTGALDDVETAVKLLKPELQKAGMDMRTIFHGSRPCERRGFWFHVDGALGAGYATYTKKDRDFTLPSFDFTNDVQSIVMSGHKWPGAPWPTGIYMTQNRYMLTNDVPSYVGSLDSTLAGSRSGIAPVFLWDWIARGSDADRTKEATEKLELARYALDRIKAVYDKDATRAPGSLMVVFKRPSEHIIRKYALASTKDHSHLVCMRHVDAGLVHRLIEDLLKSSARPTTESLGEALAGVDEDIPAVVPFGDEARGGY